MVYQIYSLIVILLTIIYIKLTFAVISERRNTKQPIGFGEPESMLYRAYRAQANFLENSIIFMFLATALALIEESSLYISCFGVIFVLGRMLHMRGLLNQEVSEQPSFKLRIKSMQLNLVCFIGSGLRITYLICEDIYISYLMNM